MPKTLKASCSSLLSMVVSRPLMKMLPRPELQTHRNQDSTVSTTKSTVNNDREFAEDACVVPAEGGVALAPADAAGALEDGAEVEGVDGALSVLNRLEVDVGVAERATGDGIAADADGGDGSNHTEVLEQDCLGDLRWMQWTANTSAFNKFDADKQYKAITKAKNQASTMQKAEHRTSGLRSPT